MTAGIQHTMMAFTINGIEKGVTKNDQVGNLSAGCSAVSRKTSQSVMAIYTNKEWDDVHMTKEINQRSCEWVLATGGKCAEYATDESGYCPVHRAEYAAQQAEFARINYGDKYQAMHTVQGDQRACQWMLASGVRCADYATDEGDYCPAHQAEYARGEVAVLSTSPDTGRTERARWLNEAAAIAPTGTNVGDLISVANWIIGGGEGW